MLCLLLEIKKIIFDTNNSLAETPSTLTIKKNDSVEEIRALEDELVNPSYFTEVVNQCVRLGGHNKRAMVSNLMCRFMTKNLMCQYNLLG